MSLFKGLVFAIVGTFPKVTTHKSLQTELEAEGAVVTKKLEESTHIICSASEWTNQGSRALACRALNTTRVQAGTPPAHILPIEWLRMCLSTKKKAPEKLSDMSLEPEDATEAKVDDDEGGETAEALEDEPVQVGEKGTKSKAKVKGKGKRARDSGDESDHAAQVAAVATVPKMVTVVKKGASPPVDARFPHKASTHVYADDQGMYYDAMLNQTEVGKNANKFYIIQVLQSDHGSTFYCFNAWGRVGENGQTKVFGPWSGSVGPALAEFGKKFKDKTKLTWANRLGPPAAGKYTFLERSFEDDDEVDTGPSDAGPAPKKSRTAEPPAAESKLSPAVQSLMKFIFNTGYLYETMSSFEYDAAKLPLGKLAKSTLEQGYAALKDIAALLANPTLAQTQHSMTLAAALQKTTNRYYTLIPHAFGRHVPPVIGDDRLLKRELDLIDALGDLKITQEIMATKGSIDASGSFLHPLDAQYQNLGLKQLDSIDRQSSEFASLQKLLDNTKGVTHTSWNLTLVEGFKVERERDHQNFKAGGYHVGGERRLLWHGSRSANYGGILSEGLRIAPPAAPVSGYMFGKGVYLASLSSKSAQYCYHGISNNEGLLMLVEAQLGEQPAYQREQAEYEAEESCRRAGKLSTWGIGRTQPAGWEDAGVLSKELAGVLMPSLSVPPREVNKSSSLLYDEFIVYRQEQCIIRYLLRVKFNSPVGW